MKSETESELLEVLPEGPLPSAELHHYIVRLQHDLGTIRVITTAADHRAAIIRVLEAAGAPRSAVLTVQKIKTKRREATPGNILRTLKYAGVSE
jgi:hypothetical protein